MDYVSQLREGILEAYTGIVTGLKKTEKGMFFLLLRNSHADVFFSIPSTSTRSAHSRVDSPLSKRRRTNGLGDEVILWSSW